MEHLHRTKEGENKGHHYLGKETKNQIINLIGSSITNNILLMMKSAKYYCIILDCTQDISNIEQMTVVVRFVQETKLHGVYDVQIWEHFLAFLPVPDSLCSTLMQVVLKFLEDKKILLCNMRGQERTTDDLTPLRFQIGDVFDALVQISEKFNGMTAHETRLLVNQIKIYAFLTSLVI
ncbi:uncharacterized protein LOC124722651 [Schistocerca piceifrons]|uniref:uncharacterized protein LOC124722651 n=1 Tax=Schistocerca piceifrons TaxID=274613 RepID=UPI001F5EFE60|nr:uncharacterized protein LOC124722651 [Schistocerca piceifrons]